jgi:hypothetical protein
MAFFFPYDGVMIMGIFNVSNVIQPTGVEVKAPVSPVAPVENDKTGLGTGNPAADGAEAAKPKTVVMNGPLSKIYSDALNLVYSKESAMTMINPEDMELMDEQAGSGDSKDLYIYTTDGDKLDGSEMVEAGDKLKVALDSKKYKNVLLVMESRTPSTKVALLHDLANSMGVKVVFNRNAAIENVKACLK